MKANNRLTKQGVLEEIQILRNKIRVYSDMSTEELRNEYLKTSANCDLAVLNAKSRDQLISTMLIQATYHMTNVLGLE